MWKNLAPNLIRQRLIIEGTREKIVEPEQIRDFLIKLADELKMEILSEPFIDVAHEMGYSGYIHWKTSGSHFYSYHTNPTLFTIDIYTCKAFPIEKALEFTKEYFNPIEIVYKEIPV